MISPVLQLSSLIITPFKVSARFLYINRTLPYHY